MLYEEHQHRQSRRALFWGLCLSITLHLGALLTNIGRIASHSLDISSQTTPIEVTQIPESQLQELLAKKQPLTPKEKIIAETEDAKNRKEDPNAYILSDKTQTAEQQTKAKVTDDFRAQEGTGLKGITAKDSLGIPPTGDTPEELSESESPESEIEIGENKKQGVRRDWRTLSLKDLSMGLGDGRPSAATDDHLDRIDFGDRTILSTREFRYFSYYHRIKELLRQYWKPNVERKIVKMWRKGKNIGEAEHVTKLLVLLTPRGKIEKIAKIETSGVREIDDAAVEAFEKAGPFPHPPKGIIDTDGFVRIRWDFILMTEAAPQIQFQRVGNGGREVP